MANVLVNEASLADIADAIREKNGTEETYKPAEMGAAIRGIESGGGVDTLALALKKTIVEYEFKESFELAEAVFSNNNLVKKLSFPCLISVCNSAFKYCYGLLYIDLGNITTLNASVLYSCNNLETLVLRSNTLCSLSGKINSTTMNGDGCFIYVPKALLETYKAATNWVTYADDFRALEDYTVDGTITGALDETKIVA